MMHFGLLNHNYIKVSVKRKGKTMHQQQINIKNLN